MAEKRRFAEPAYGQPGNLTYIPRSRPESGPGQLHTKRFTSEAPSFRVLGSSTELYPPSKTDLPDASPHLWREGRVQRRWLFNSHPQASVGNQAFPKILEHDMRHYQNAEDPFATGSLLATGEISDLSDASRPTGAPVLAAAAGESGELLRLTLLSQSLWQWGSKDDAYLDLSVIDAADHYDEVTWALDSLPLGQVKFASSKTRYDSIRWLIVQKQTSTTVLQPVYRRLPLAQVEADDTRSMQPRSRIDPNPVLTLTHQQTGGNAHSDVVFNPPAQGQPPQIALIDECGYWSIWNILGQQQVSKLSWRPSLCQCGHISAGLLSEIPHEPLFGAEKHGMLFVGKASKEEFWQLPDSGLEDPGTLAARSQLLLMWNRERVVIFDMATSTFNNQPLHPPTVQRQPTWILDVQRSPGDRNQVFVLTSRFLLWVDINKRKSSRMGGFTILASCPLADNLDEKPQMTVARAARQDSVLVFIHTSVTESLVVYWFSMSPDSQLPSWQQYITFLPKAHASSTTKIRQLNFDPVALTVIRKSPLSPGAIYEEQRVQFFQGCILGDDLSVHNFVCVAIPNASFQVDLPTIPVGRSEIERRKRWRRRRKQLVTHPGAAAFVVSDERLLSHGGSESRATTAPSTFVLEYQNLAEALAPTLGSMNPNYGLRPSKAFFDVVEKAIEHGIARGRLPLVTWHELASTIGPQEASSIEADQLDEALQDLFEHVNSMIVIDRLGKPELASNQSAAELLHSLDRQYNDTWVAPLDMRWSEEWQEKRRSWTSEIAREVFLESYGVMIQDTKLIGPVDSSFVDDSQKSVPSSVPLPSSQSDRQSLQSSPPSSQPPAASGESDAPSDAAFRRLQLLAPSCRPGSLGNIKPAYIFSFWPSERGIEPSESASSTAVEHEKQFDDARQRLQRLESKKKSKTDKLDKLKRPAFMRQGFRAGEDRSTQSGGRDIMTSQPQTEATQVPAPQIMTSQAVPSSSQTLPPVTMSQPAAGPFGGRKKVKKAKKKSGFR